MPHGDIDSETLAMTERLVGSDRVIAVLLELAKHPQGVTLDELAAELQSSKPTVHRALATLRRAGLADLIERGVYLLGDEYLRLAFRNLAGRPDTVRIQPLLEELASAYGETAHYAVLSGVDIVYRAKMDPPVGAVRLTSVVGGRNPAYRTAVGKALLSTQLRSQAEVDAWCATIVMERKTPHSIVTTEALYAELAASAERGFGIDDQENELGVNCVSIPIFLDGALAPVGAISVSGVTFRCSLDRLIEAIPDIKRAIVRHLGENAVA